MTRTESSAARAAAHRAREFHFGSCISVCFHDEGREDIVTLENYTRPTADALRAEFERLRQEFQEPDADLMVDLYIDYDLMDTFLIRRQLLDRMRADLASGTIVVPYDPEVPAYACPVGTSRVGSSEQTDLPGS